MRVWLAYGRDGLHVRIPDGAHAIEPQFEPALPAPLEAVRQALAKPLGTLPLKDLLDSKQRVCIVHSDGTRPMPGELLLTALAEVFFTGWHSGRSDHSLERFGHSSTQYAGRAQRAGRRRTLAPLPK